MNRPRNLRNRLDHVIPALVAVGVLSLGACSANSDNASSDVGKASTTAAQRSSSKPSDTNKRSNSKPTGAAVKPTSLLPMDADAPDGYKMITARCDATEAAAKSDDAKPSDRHRSALAFAAPQGWSPVGSGTGGSGTVVSTHTEIDFDLDSGGQVTVSSDWDAHTMDGGIAESGGRPWKTFDYDASTGDKSIMITYDKVGTVSVGDQNVDLYYRDPSQAPDDLSTAQYKARIKVLEMPRSETEPDVALVYSVVVTIEFDADESSVTQDVVEKIVGSYNMPTCTWNDVLDEQEVLLQLDLNGDGKVKSAADRQKELKDKQDELEKKRSQESGN